MTASKRTTMKVQKKAQKKAQNFVFIINGPLYWDAKLLFIHCTKNKVFHQGFLHFLCSYKKANQNKFHF